MSRLRAISIGAVIVALAGVTACGGSSSSSRKKLKITSVNPNTGNVNGGQSVAIFGQGFKRNPSVTFAGLPAQSIAFTSSKVLTVTTPAGAPVGPADVTVTNLSGKSFTLVGGFTFTDPFPSISSVVPATGDTLGGLSVTITGNDFVNGATVSFSGLGSPSVTYLSATSLMATTPAGAPTGPGDVVVTNPNTNAGTLVDGFAFFPPSGGTFNIATVATDPGFAVAMAFPPDFLTTDRIFVTEKSGEVRIIQGGAYLPTPFVTVTVDSNGERGLLGIAFDPDYASNDYVYIHYTPPGTPTPTQTVERYTDSSNIGTNPFVVIQDLPSTCQFHNGGNIAFGPDDRLYITLGDDCSPSNSPNLDVFPGKILRIASDGTQPTDNPWWTPAGSDPNNLSFASGLRNSFDLAFHPITGELYASENGPNANDELNLIVGGDDYGWDGAQTSGPRSMPGLTDPVDWFDPPPSLTGVAFNVGYRYPEDHWGDIFIGAWNTGDIYRCDLDPGNAFLYDRANRTTVDQVPAGSITDIAQGPDGYLYVSSGGTIYRIEYN